jgi:putative ABC transport system substrate-binding protein
MGAVAATWPLAARSQQRDRVATIGYLTLFTVSPGAPWPTEAGFLAGLRDLGYAEGKNFRIEYRSTHGDESRLGEMATELVRLNVDVIVTAGSGVYAARRATSTMPIVMTSAGDVVAMGIVDSLAHPGGNVTGLTIFAPEVMAKRLELLKQVSPDLVRAGVLLLRNSPSNSRVLELMRAAAKTLKVELFPIEIDPWDIEAAFATWSDERVGGFVAGDDPQLVVSNNAVTIAVLSAKRRLPSIGPPDLATWGA